MQKFRDYIYCDRSRIDSYIGQIKELNKSGVTESYERETSVDGELKVPFAGGGTTLKEKESTSYQSNVSPLEQIINWANESKNAINYDGEILKEQDKDKLVVLSGKISVPEMSENIESINSFAGNSQLFDMLPISDEDKKKIDFLKKSDNIPILLELDSEYVFHCNLKKDYLQISIDDFFDNVGEYINVIGKIEKIYNTEDDVEIYDLTKDIFKLNRTIRRKLPKDKLQDAIVTEKGPLVKITPIVVYK